MQKKKQFIKKDRIELDTFFFKLPIFGVKNYKEVITINEKINGIDFEFIGYGLNMNLDFKMFCHIISNEITEYKNDIKVLMKLFGYQTKSINSKTKNDFIESFIRLHKANFNINSNKRGQWFFNIISFFHYENESNIIEFSVSKQLIDLLKTESNNFFLNYEDLDKNFGKKMIHKKLFMFFEHHKIRQEFPFKWDNIFKTLGIYEPNKDDKKRVKKAIDDLKDMGIINGYRIEKRDKIIINLRDNYKNEQGKIIKFNKKINENKIKETMEDVPF